MIGLIQRVSRASVAVGGEAIAAIGRGILVLVAVEPADGEAQAIRMAERLLGYRIFPDADGKMNRSTRDIGGGVLLVPQFTLAADTTRGTRPSFTSAAPPECGRRLFEALERALRERYEATVCCGISDREDTLRGESSAARRWSPALVQTGRFGADMEVALVNEGPVTFLLHVNAR